METLNPSSSDLTLPSGLEVESASWRTRLTSRVQPRVAELKTKVNDQVHAKPALFAGIAAGLGFALGLTGRIARHRRAAAKKLPAFVVIEGAC